MTLSIKNNKVSSLKKGESALSEKKDMKIITSYIEARLKAELNRQRFNQKMGTSIDFSDAAILNQAQNIIHSVINDIDEINKRTDAEKKIALLSKNSGDTELSPDEIYAMDLSALKDIKKAGLNRQLTKEEGQTLKQATNDVNLLYSESVQIYKERNKIR